MDEVLARTTALFEDLPPEALAHVLAVGQVRMVPAGTLLLRQGAPSPSLHVLLWGRVRVESTVPGTATAVVLGELGPGEVVGEMGLLEQAPRSATVVALEPTTTLELGLEAVAILATEQPTITAALLRTLTARLRAANTLVAAARAEAERLAGVLLAVRTLEHFLNDQLARTVGYCELIAQDARLPPEVRARAREAQAGAEEAAATMQRLGRIRRVRERGRVGMPTILDLEQASAPDEPAG